MDAEHATGAVPGGVGAKKAGKRSSQEERGGKHLQANVAVGAVSIGTLLSPVLCLSCHVGEESLQEAVHASDSSCDANIIPASIPVTRTSVQASQSAGK